MSPTQRTKAMLKDKGIHCEVVEKWIQYGPNDPRRKWRPGERQDLMGIIDVLAFTKDNLIGIQCCAGSGYSAHIRKLMEDRRDRTELFLSYPYTRLEIHAWRKVKVKRGGKATRWEPRICVIDQSDMEG